MTLFFYNNMYNNYHEFDKKLTKCNELNRGIKKYIRSNIFYIFCIFVGCIKYLYKYKLQQWTAIPNYRIAAFLNNKSIKMIYLSAVPSS